MRQSVCVHEQVRARVIADQEVPQRLRGTQHVENATAKSLVGAETSPKAGVASFDNAQKVTKGQIGVCCRADLFGDAREYVVVEGLKCSKRVQQCSSLLRLDETATCKTACSE